MGGAHEIVKGLQSYMHITEKVRVREWERIQTLWCKGHRGVKPGSTRPPDPTPLWCCSPQDVGPWGGSAWRSPGTGPLPLASGVRGQAFVPKENVRGFGWGWGKVTYWEHGEREVRSKQTDWGNASDHFLSRWVDDTRTLTCQRSLLVYH